MATSRRRLTKGKEPSAAMKAAMSEYKKTGKVPGGRIANALVESGAAMKTKRDVPRKSGSGATGLGRGVTGRGIVGDAVRGKKSGSGSRSSAMGKMPMTKSRKDRK